MGLVAGAFSGTAASQELEPRSFSASPVGTGFMFTGVGNSSGAFVLDPSEPIADVEADLSFMAVGGGQTFGVAGRQARVVAVLPYARGEVSGAVDGSRQSGRLAGWSDPRIKLSIGLTGAPALSPDEFECAPRRTIVAAHVTLMAPLGQYDATSLVNLGYNRWAVKPEVGVSHSFGSWTVDGSVGAWLFTDNESYYPGLVARSQEPVGALQTHLSYEFRRGSWVALDTTWFAGGRTSANGISKQDRQRNRRIGVSFAIPVTDRQSLKLAYSTGSSTRRGSDFDTLNLTWQVAGF
jgi:hypothetical protein